MKRSIKLSSLLMGLLVTASISGCPASPKGMDAYKKGVQIVENHGKTMDAKVHLVKALNENPELAEAHIMLGHVLFQEGFYVEAQEQSQKGVELLEKNQKVLDTSKTWQQFASLGLTNMGIVEVRKSANNVEKTPEALAKKRATAEQAIQYFSRALELSPENKRAKDELAQLKSEYGK